MKQKLILQSLVMDTDLKSKLRAAKSEFLNEQLQNILIQEKNEEILLALLNNRAISKTNILKIKDILGIEETQEEKNRTINKIKELNNYLILNKEQNQEQIEKVAFLSNELSLIELEIRAQIALEIQLKSIINIDIEEYNYLFLEDISVDINIENNKLNNIINITEIKESKNIDILTINKKEYNLKGKLLERFL